MQNKEEDYFHEQKNWSKRKLSIITSYLASFTKILGSNAPQSNIYYIDGFAGRGIYEDKSEGSPVLAAKLAEKYYVEEKKYQIKCINVESDSENFKNLEDSTIRYRRHVENLFGTFSSQIPLILDKIGISPAYFFIDPFGVKGTDWNDMKMLLSRKHPTDLWLRFDHITVRRLFGSFDSDSPAAKSKVQRLLCLYGIDNTNDLIKLLDGPSCEKRIENAVDLYVGKLEKELKAHKSYGYSAAFPIIPLEGRTKYYLVFAASHKKAAMLASETIYMVERNRPDEVFEYQQNKTGQLFLLPIDPTEEELNSSNIEKLIAMISTHFSNIKINRNDLYIKIIESDQKKWFGCFSNSQLNVALKQLESGSNPKIINREGPRSKGTTLFTFR
jgi:three-Cys-motif partner protein